MIEQITIVEQQSDVVYSWLLQQRALLEEDLDKVQDLKVTLLIKMTNWSYQLCPSSINLNTNLCYCSKNQLRTITFFS